MESRKIYDDIAKRTDGDIYIGVVGPVRTGKSTFIKRFMETLVIPNIDNVYRRERAKDELPQSGSGRTIMTAEPKFVPEEAVRISVGGGANLTVRMIDCVGYLVAGAMGQFEGDAPRMVTTPWFDRDIPMPEAAELGTRKVINEHSTIGVVVTTDGSITDIPREDYIEPEERVIAELKAIGKPFIVLLNSAYPNSERAQSIREDIAKRHNVTCISVNCAELQDADVTDIVRGVLFEFPINEFGVFLPTWVEALPHSHPIKVELFSVLRSACKNMEKLRDIDKIVGDLSTWESAEGAKIRQVLPGRGEAQADISMSRGLFYKIIGEQSGFQINDDGDLMELLTKLSRVKNDYDKIEGAIRDVRELGYGIVMPSTEELSLEEPEIVKQGGRYGVRLRASAPSIHMIRADIETEVSPIVGNERQSEELIHYLLQEFDGEPGKIWQSNIFGKSLHELVSEGLHNKLKRMPDDARSKLQETLQRIINEGSGGLICIIL